MIAEILLGTLGTVGLGSAITALVFRGKNGNGKHEPEVIPQSAPVQVQWPPELAALLTHIKSDLEENDKRLTRLASDLSENMAEAMSRFYGHSGLWKQMLESLTEIHDRMTEPVTAMLPPELTAGLDRVTDRLELLLQTPSPELPVAELAQLAAPLAALPERLEVGLDRLSNQIQDLVDMERKRAAVKPAEPPKTSLKGDAPPALPSPMLAPPPPKKSKPITRAAAPVVLEEFNTITMAEFTIYELHPLEEGVFSANVLNLGPGWLYMRENDEPTIGDPKATTLPPGAIDNEIRVAQRLYVLATADGSITVRLMH